MCMYVYACMWCLHVYLCDIVQLILSLGVCHVRMCLVHGVCSYVSMCASMITEQMHMLHTELNLVHINSYQ